jgi:hypothetical protein
MKKMSIIVDEDKMTPTARYLSEACGMVVHPKPWATEYKCKILYKTLFAEASHVHKNMDKVDELMTRLILKMLMELRSFLRLKHIIASIVSVVNIMYQVRRSTHNDENYDVKESCKTEEELNQDDGDDDGALLGSPFHAIHRFKLMMKHYHRKAFYVALCEAFFQWNEHDLTILEATLAGKKKMDSKAIYLCRYFKRKYFSKRCRRICLPPSRLYWRRRICLPPHDYIGESEMSLKYLAQSEM